MQTGVQSRIDKQRKREEQKDMREGYIQETVHTHPIYTRGSFGERDVVPAGATTPATRSCGVGLQ